jgi:hypothetical protein
MTRSAETANRFIKGTHKLTGVFTYHEICRKRTWMPFDCYFSVVPDLFSAVSNNKSFYINYIKDRFYSKTFAKKLCKRNFALYELTHVVGSPRFYLLRYGIDKNSEQGRQIIGTAIRYRMMSVEERQTAFEAVTKEYAEKVIKNFQEIF